MSKAGQRIFASLTFIVLAGFLTKPAFAQIPLGSVSPTPEQAYMCGSPMLPCSTNIETFKLDFKSQEEKPSLLESIKASVKIHKSQNSIGTELSSLKVEPKKLPQKKAVEKKKVIPQTYAYSTPVANDAVLNSDKIQDLINNYRQNLGLAPFMREDSVCSLAKTRSIEMQQELSNGTLHSGLYNRNLPYWIWENAKVGSNEEDTVAWWIWSPVHRSSMVGNYKYSCGACTGTYCSQLFTSFEPKVTAFNSASNQTRY